jgi:TolA-binding protein
MTQQRAGQTSRQAKQDKGNITTKYRITDLAQKLEEFPGDLSQMQHSIHQCHTQKQGIRGELEFISDVHQPIRQDSTHRSRDISLCVQTCLLREGVMIEGK